MEQLEQTERIEAYLEGKLKGNELKDFEQELLTNKELKDDFTLQRRTVQMVKSAGALQLKDDLENIHQDIFGGKPVTKKLIESPLLAPGLVGIVAIGVLAWWLWPTPHEAVEMASTPNKNIPKTTVAPKASTSSTPSVETVKEAPKVEKTIAAPKPIVKKANKVAKHNAKSTKTGTQIINNDKNYRFHYRFYEGQLTLFGEFDQKNAEFSTDAYGQQYLVYENKAYPLRETENKVVPLESIEDKEVLEQVQKNAPERVNLNFMGTTSKMNERFLNKNNIPKERKLAALAEGVQEVKVQLLLNDRNPDYQVHYQFLDDLMLTLYGNFANMPKQVVKNADGEYFLILSEKNEIYELEKGSDKIQKLKKVKRKNFKKVILVPDEEEL